MGDLQRLSASGALWMILAVVIGLGLATWLGALRGVGLGLAFSLFTLGACRLALPLVPDEYALSWVNPPAPAILGGILGGLIGGVLDRPRGTATTWEHSWSVRLALAGVAIGFGVGLCAFASFARII